MRDEFALFGLRPRASTAKALGLAAPSVGTPTTAPSATAGWESRVSSTSIEEDTFSPPAMMMMMSLCGRRP